MGLPELEIDHVLMKRWLKLMCLRVAVLGAHFISISDALNSAGRYPILQQCYKGGPCPSTSSDVGNITKPVKPVIPVVKPDVIGTCKMKGPFKELDSHFFNFNMAFFMILGFYGFAVINFIVKCVINFRLVLCPVPQDADACGNLLPTIWHKIRDATFNFATFPCDTAIMSCVVGLYASKRGAGGLGCWQCSLEPTCTKEDDLDSLLFMSSFALNLNFFLVLIIVFYKGFITYFRATDPDKCDCHCEIPRCVTGCFVSLITTSVIMMPPFVVLSDKYYDLPGVEGNLFSMIMGNMKMIGIIIWAVIGIFLFIVIPMKLILLRNKDAKK